jgi:hypothetical protein
MRNSLLAAALMVCLSGCSSSQGAGDDTSDNAPVAAPSGEASKDEPRAIAPTEDPKVADDPTIEKRDDSEPTPGPAVDQGRGENEVAKSRGSSTVRQAPCWARPFQRGSYRVNGGRVKLLYRGALRIPGGRPSGPAIESQLRAGLDDSALCHSWDSQWYWRKVPLNNTIVFGFWDLYENKFGWVAIHSSAKVWSVRCSYGRWVNLKNSKTKHYRFDVRGKTIRLSVKNPANTQGWGSMDIQFGFGL